MKLRSIIAVLMSALMLLSLSACGDGAKETETEPPVVYTEIDYTTVDFNDYIKLCEYKGLEVSIPPLGVDISSVTKELEKMVEDATVFEEYSTPVTDRLTVAGDYVEINFRGYLDGELLVGGSADGVAILLGEDNGYVEWLDDDLYGIMPGTSVETTGVFPEDYQYTEFAGEQVTFTIDLLSIKGHYDIPVLDDAFIAAQTEYETLEAYRTAKIEALIEVAEEEYEMQKLQLAWEAILEATEVIEIPEQQYLYYYMDYRNNVMEYAKLYDYTYEEYLAAVGLEDSMFQESAKGKVKEELVFYAIVKAEGYTVSDEEYTEGVKKYADVQGVTVEELEAQYSKEELIDNVLWDKVMYAMGDLVVYAEEPIPEAE